MAHNLPHTTAPPPSLTELGIRLAGDVPRDELGVGGSLLRRYLRKWRRAISDMLRITSSPAQLAPSSSSSLTSRCTPSSSSSPGHTPPTPARDLPPAPALATSQMSVQHRSDAKALNRVSMRSVRLHRLTRCSGSHVLRKNAQFRGAKQHIFQPQRARRRGTVAVTATARSNS